MRRAILMMILTLTITMVAELPALSAPGTRPDCEQVRESVRSQLDAACPCDTAKGHGGYVRCIANKLRDLSACHPEDGTTKCGPVPRACAGRIRRMASKSTCGSDEVTCCIPKQHDCVGDSAPGDGNAQGACAGTRQHCDTVTDCLVPKCVRATSADNCQRAGGKVGSGKDCANACAP